MNDVKIGDRVRSSVDGAIGSVTDIDYASIVVRWDDGTYSMFLRSDGFCLWSLYQEEAA